MATSALKMLRTETIEASAPCRMDSGGTWDIKSLALPLENIHPVTINVAVSLRTRVLLSPFLKGEVRIASEGFDHAEEAPFEALPFDSPFGLFFAAASYFGFHGFQAQITSDSPVKSALGGSSTALVAFIKALSRLRERLGDKTLSPREILHLGYHLEDAVAAGKCGIQDQAAAVYGGVNLWTWHFGNRLSLYEREPLLDRKAQREMSNTLFWHTAERVMFPRELTAPGSTIFFLRKQGLAGSRPMRWSRGLGKRYEGETGARLPGS